MRKGGGEGGWEGVGGEKEEVEKVDGVEREGCKEGRGEKKGVEMVAGRGEQGFTEEYRLCLYMMPSNRMGNLTSVEPTMFCGWGGER